jgi:hypothetical protein
MTVVVQADKSRRLTIDVWAFASIVAGRLQHINFFAITPMVYCSKSGALAHGDLVWSL